ncbi:hypothetical protein LCS78_27535, partial [Vibrio harveyi]|uniref:hypothetical protein n=1 Tax=Vibrio harveyi TaxID=669 RepID=UPI003BB76631
GSELSQSPPVFLIRWVVFVGLLRASDVEPPIALNDISQHEQSSGAFCRWQEFLKSKSAVIAFL